tara:strand:- start:409 stop:777 length:369 start_codon:yes stop_codon:yes gene_type:complete
MVIEYFKITAQIVIALSIYNVWFLRFNKPTKFRGKNAKSMKDEFLSYGLPSNFVWIIGFLKVTLATLLLVGIIYNEFIFPAASGMAILMAGAISMHVKVKDELIKSLPAAIFLVLSLSIALL